MFEVLRQQTDYVVFALAATAVFAALGYALPRIRNRASLPRIGWLILVIVLVAGWFPVRKGGEDERQQIQTLVSALAPTYARELARAGHEKITEETPRESPEFQKLLGLLSEWTSANPIAADIYTMRRKPDGTHIFILDADTDYDGDGKIAEREIGARAGEPFAEEDAGLDLAYRGVANFNPEIVTDRWGSWVGAWAPIFGPDGKVDAVLGVDYDAVDWLRAIRRVRLERILILSLILAVVGGSLSAVGIFRGIAVERQLLLTMRAETEQRLRLTLEQMPLAFLEIDPQGTIVGWNPAAERLFGYTREEAVGKLRVEDMVTPAGRDQVETLMANLLRQPMPRTNVNDNMRKDGRVVRCEWYNAQVVGLDGSVLSIVSLAQDVTERQNIEEQVRQSQRLAAVGQLAAGIAHDFNNLLTVINGHTDLLLTRADLPERVKEDLKRIARAGDRAANLTTQLLTFGRKQPIFARVLDLHVFLRAAWEKFQALVSSSISIELDLGECDAVILGDVALIEHALTNLALNSRDAMPNGGTLRIATQRAEITLAEARSNPDRRAGEFVKLSVSDNGKGIAPEIMPRIFEPFFTTKEVGKGTGLGLSAVHGVMKQHGGWVEVRSSPLGTTFELFFPPAARTVPERSGSESEAPPQSQAGTVLLVEDDATVRHVARLSLERAGYHVLEAEDGPAAEQIWSEKKRQIGILVTDMVMPHGVGGRELADRLTIDRPGLPVVFVSGYTVEAVVPNFVESSHTTLLQKPFLPEHLIAAVQRVTDPQARNKS